MKTKAKDSLETDCQHFYLLHLKAVSGKLTKMTDFENYLEIGQKLADVFPKQNKCEIFNLLMQNFQQFDSYSDQ